MKKSECFAILILLAIIRGFVSCSNDPKVVEKEVEKVVEKEVEKVVEKEVEKVVEVDKKADETAPSNVTNLTATAKNERVLLTWIDALDEDVYGYEITYNGTSAINRVILPALDSKTMMVGKDAGGCYISGLTNGTTYTFIVKTVDTSGNKSEGVTVSATPVILDAGKTMQIALTASVPQENGYSGTKSKTQVTVTATITTASDVSRVVWKKNGSINAKTLLADSESTDITEIGDNSKWNFDIVAADETANGIYTVAAIDADGREEAEQIIIDQFDFSGPAQVELKNAVYENSSFILEWIEPNDTDYDHVEITYTANNGISDSNISDPVNVIKGTTNKTFSEIDSTKSYYTYSFVTVDTLGNRGAVCNYRVSIDGIISDSGVDFNDYTSNYALIVKNNSTKNMVLFKGKPSQQNVLGGVKACSTSHIKNDKTFFSETQDFVVYVVTEENYKDNKDFLLFSAQPYTTFYAVYNTNMINSNVYEIPSLNAGAYKIVVNNASIFNVELRSKSLNGEILGFSEPMTFEKAFHIGQGEFMVFPVFRKFDKTSREIFSVYPTYASGALAGETKLFEFFLDEGTTEVQLNVQKWLNGVKLNPSAAYIEIINCADRSLQFFTGADSTPLLTSSGGKVIYAGKSLIYSIDMANNNGTTIEESVVAAGYRLASPIIDNIYLNGDATTTQEYKAGYLYSYTVRGDSDRGYTVTPLMDEIGTTITIIDEPAYVDAEGTVHNAVTHTETATTRDIKAAPVDWLTL